MTASRVARGASFSCPSRYSAAVIWGRGGGGRKAGAQVRGKFRKGRRRAGLGRQHAPLQLPRLPHSCSQCPRLPVSCGLPHPPRPTLPPPTLPSLLASMSANSAAARRRAMAMPLVCRWRCSSCRLITPSWLVSMEGKSCGGGGGGHGVREPSVGSMGTAAAARVARPRRPHIESPQILALPCSLAAAPCALPLAPLPPPLLLLTPSSHPSLRTPSAPAPSPP